MRRLMRYALTEEEERLYLQAWAGSSVVARESLRTELAVRAVNAVRRTSHLENDQQFKDALDEQPEQTTGPGQTWSR